MAFMPRFMPNSARELGFVDQRKGAGEARGRDFSSFAALARDSSNRMVLILSATH